jgi:hypothetical protein
VRALRGPRDARPREVLAATLVALGPLLWIAWNVHAHGDPIHFFERVSRFKRALGEGSTDTLGSLLLYPRLLIGMRPDVLVAIALAVVAASTFITPRLRVMDVQRRWLVPLACAAAELAFLAYGNVRDGAPAHHSERALLGIVFLTAAFAADVLGEAVPAALLREGGAGLKCAVVLGAAWLASSAVAFRDVPGASTAEDRAAQLGAGERLRVERAEHVSLTPCAYEHFAVIAAFAEPERVTTNPSTGAAVTSACPFIERR